MLGPDESVEDYHQRADVSIAATGNSGNGSMRGWGVERHH